MTALPDIVFISPQRKYFSDNKPFPPLGIGYLAAILKELGYKIRLIDGSLTKLEEYNRQLNLIKEDIVCISTLLIHLDETVRICKIIKQKDPAKTIIIGGPGLKCIPQEKLFDTFNADYFVLAEAEEILPKLLKTLDNKNKISEIKGIVYKENETRKYTGYAPPIEDINKIPIPDRELINVRDYLRIWKNNTGRSCTDMLTSRGCPFACAYCDKGYYGEKIRFHTVNRVVDEMQELVEKYNTQDIYFMDDLFLFDKKRTIKICKEIKNRGLDVAWGGHARVDTIDKETVEHVKSAGCDELNFGVETGSPEILEYLNKGTTIDVVEKAFKHCHEVGIEAGAYLIVGIPKTKRKDIELTKQLIAKIKPAMIVISYFTPFPGTKFYEEYERHFIKKNFYKWDEFNNSILNYDFDVDPVEEYNDIFNFYVNSVVPTAPKVAEWFQKTMIEQKGINRMSDFNCAMGTGIITPTTEKS